MTAFPKSVTSDLSQGPPDKLEFGTRILEQRTVIDGIKVHLGPHANPIETDWGMWEPVELAFIVHAPGIHTARDRLTPLLDLILDDLAFQIQQPLKVFQLELIDITEPATVGETREFLLMPFPNGYDQFKLSRSTPLGTVETRQYPTLRLEYPNPARRIQDALDWYIKGLHSQFDADRFIFWWICLEILRGESGLKVEEPTRLRCQHEISCCPVCGKSTSTYRQAATTRHFLGRVGISQDYAKRLWRMRQLVHGARSFKADELEELGELIQILHSVTTSLLKLHLGSQVDQPPFVKPGGPTFGTSIGLGGSRELRQEDLAL